MNFLFKKSTSITPKLAALARLIPSESSNSFASSTISNAPKIFKFCEVRSRKFHVGTKSLSFRTSESVRFGFAVQESTYEEEDEGLEIAKLGIDEQIVACLAKKGISKLFPIQKAVLEPAMQGRDMIGRAKTGTGKTLAFGIPIMDKIIQYNAKYGRGKNPLAMVLAPTRELAKQVEKEFKESAPLDTLCVYGGTPIYHQIRTLELGVDVIVGTPGRVIDLLKRGSLNLSEVQFVVLDEADQMLAVGFADAVETILSNLPPKRQSMMFSATMPNWIKQLTQKYLNNPVTVDLVGDNDQKLAEGITLYSIATDTFEKASILAPLIKEHGKGGKCIIFTQTKRDADKLAYGVAKSFQCEALHGDMSQAMRERTLSGFRDGRINVLVATDVAARGLDVPNVDLVIHYELPNNSEIFVHRSGRTGRAGKKGTAIVMHTHEQSRSVRGFEQDVGCKFIELPKIQVQGSENMFAGYTGSNYGGFGGGSGFNRGSYGGGSGYKRGGGGGYGGGSGYNRGGGGYGGGSGNGSYSGGFGSQSSGGSGFGRSGGYVNSSGLGGFGGSFGGNGGNSSPGFRGLGSGGNSSSGLERSGNSESSRYGGFNFNSS